ncbi:MAG: hypothetical protein ABFD91_08185 [Anaerohalosphaeraceae bacterium]
MNKPIITRIRRVLFYAAFILLIFAVFLAGVIFRHKMGFYDTMEKISVRTKSFQDQINGEVYSARHIARQIEHYLYIAVPDHATNLYCAIDRRCFYDHYYAALKLPDESACSEFLEKQIGITLKDFKFTAKLPDAFTEKGPSAWSEKRKGSWNLEIYDQFYICEDTGFGTRSVIYVPGHHRIFIVDSGL